MLSCLPAASLFLCMPYTLFLRLIKSLLRNTRYGLPYCTVQKSCLTLVVVCLLLIPSAFFGLARCRGITVNARFLMLLLDAHHNELRPLVEEARRQSRICGRFFPTPITSMMVTSGAARLQETQAPFLLSGLCRSTPHQCSPSTWR